MRTCEGPADVEGVVAQWRSLPPADRKRCLALIALEARTAPDDRDAEKALWAEAVQEALAAALGPSDGAGHGVQVVRQLVGAPGAWTPVAEFMQAAGLGELTRPEQYAAFRLLARLLVMRSKRVAARADIPLTPKLVASNAVHLAGIFDGEFPGYLASGLARVVVRQLVAGAGPRGS